MEREAAYTLAMMLALISVSSHIAIPLPFSDADAQTMIVNLIGLLIAIYTGYHFSYGELALLRLIGVPVFSGGSGQDETLGPSGGYYIGFLVVKVPDFPLFCRKWKNVAFRQAFPDCSWYSGDLRIRCRLDETRDRTAVGVQLSCSR